MKTTFIEILIALIIVLCILDTQQETRIIEAIKKNDSINAVKFLNREK